MPEVSRPREHHGDAVVIGSLDHLVVPHGAAGLDHGSGAGFHRDQEPIGEGKERVGCDHRAESERLAQAGGLRRVLGFPRGDARGIDRLIWPAPIPTVARSLA